MSSNNTIELFTELLKDVIHTKDLLNSLNLLVASCKNKEPEPYERDLDGFEILIKRCSLRVLYHAENFLNKLIKIVTNNIIEIPENKSFVIKIQPDIYFEFDAFLYSCKSIVDKNILGRGKNYFAGTEFENKFIKVAEEIHSHLEHSAFDYFRNEAVHLNHFGSSISEYIEIIRRDGEINIILHSMHKTIDDDKEINLIKAFFDYCPIILKFILKILQLICKNIFQKYGIPENKEIKFYVGHSKFTLDYYIGKMTNNII